MSKWGIEEKETLETIKRMGFKGNILNIAAGDGRFNNELLKLADKVIAIDNNNQELEILKNDCPNEFNSKLEVKNVDITKHFPFLDKEFDGVFCTGTLHLFQVETIINILNEIKRVLKQEGVILLDFATEITRLDNYGNKVIFAGEGEYSNEEAINIFKDNLKEFEIDIEKSSFKEENLEDNGSYKSIVGDFLIISGVKKN